MNEQQKLKAYSAKVLSFFIAGLNCFQHLLYLIAC